MKTTIGVICVLVLTVVQARGPGRRMLCNADFPIYVDCLTKEGLPEHIKTYWECRETAKPSVTDDVFFKEVCRDDNVRHEFADCIHKHKLNGTVPPVPTVCKKILGQRSLGKGVRRYLCANKERYECMKVKAPAERFQIRGE
ncbi:uncharacterized protein LOC143239149 [Tachypleus tridentatus]|uniref:uncharacterized protein LOC143239149 n=1 Tax=Tachypleus tridentatus TaxID=6853 RepID=UPI003FD401A8